MRWESLHADAPLVRRRRRERRNPFAHSIGRHLDHGFRPDIEGMRAIAVIVVVVYHARFFGMHGGFVGVDVFFVLSGFLITRLVLSELATTGRLSLTNFWGRRARRLLPASALVVVATAVATYVLLPPLTQRSVATDVLAAGTFTSNMVFAGRLGGYFGAQLSASMPSPLLHFWSLAVEEQFYLCWPPLLVLLSRRPRQYRRLLLATIVGVGVVGAVLAIWMTPRWPSWAFYLLPTRMGELLAGALLAVLGVQVRWIPAVARVILAWGGLGLIVVAAFRFDATMPWPGSAVLLIVAATMAVVIGGSVTRYRWAPAHLLKTEPLQWIGRHSYALYLWHWPVLVLAEGAWGPLSWYQRVVGVAVAVGLSALSLRVVEDPVRHARALAAVPVRSLALGAALVAAVLATGWVARAAIPTLDSGEQAATPELVGVAAATSTTLVSPAVDPVTTVPSAPSASAPTLATPTTLAGATTLAPTTTVVITPTTAPPILPDPPTGELGALVASMQTVLTNASAAAPVPSNLRPSLGAARDRALPYTQGCVNIGRQQRLQPCDFGLPGAATTIVLYGDSHAAQWFEPLNLIAIDRGYHLVLLTKGGCPVTDVVVPTPVLRHTCPPYRDAAIQWIETNQPALIVVSNSYTQYDDDAATWAAGAAATMARLAVVTDNLAVIGDNPASTVDPPACLSDHVTDTSACATARADAVRTDRISGEYLAAQAHGVTYIDTTDWFCTPTTCPAVVGDLLVMRDDTHLTPPMAEFMRPLVEAALAPVLPTG